MNFATTSNNKPVILNENGTWKYWKPSRSTIDKLRAIQQPPEVVDLFKPMFQKLGIEIIDTNEKITSIHQGELIEFEEGLDKGNVDFTISIYSYQIDILANNVATGYHDPLARFQLFREFFGVSLRGKKSLLNHPIITNPAFRKLINSKNVLHVYLLSPEPNEEADATFTFFFINGSWNIAQGLIGEPERVLRLTLDDVYELYLHIFSGSSDTKLSDINEMAKWYINWRQKVQVEAT